MEDEKAPPQSEWDLIPIEEVLFHLPSASIRPKILNLFPIYFGHQKGGGKIHNLNPESAATFAFEIIFVSTVMMAKRKINVTQLTSNHLK